MPVYDIVSGFERLNATCSPRLIAEYY